MRIFQCLIVSGFAIGLGSCGYQPLYGTSTNGGQLSSQLASVSVTPKKTRIGQLIRNEILSSIGNRFGNVPSRYRLGFSAKSEDENTAKTFGSDTVRKSYQLRVSYTLSEIPTGKIINKGNTFAHVSYDKTTASFSDYQAKINAQERAAKEIGNDIRTRLAAFFASR